MSLARKLELREQYVALNAPALAMLCLLGHGLLMGLTPWLALPVPPVHAALAPSPSRAGRSGGCHRRRWRNAAAKAFVLTAMRSSIVATMASVSTSFFLTCQRTTRRRIPNRRMLWRTPCSSPSSPWLVSTPQRPCRSASSSTGPRCLLSSTQAPPTILSPRKQRRVRPSSCNPGAP